MDEPVKIVIVLEGGLVQSVLSAGIPVEACIIDYDSDGADDDEISQIPQGDGLTIDKFVEAVARIETAEINGPRVLEIFTAVQETSHG